MADNRKEQECATSNQQSVQLKFTIATVLHCENTEYLWRIKSYNISIY
ncbi:MAG: hypothetical protein WBJ13_03960 [Sedimentibacter sp.]